jgi:hypothetical protein
MRPEGGKGEGSGKGKGEGGREKKGERGRGKEEGEGGKKGKGEGGRRDTPSSSKPSHNAMKSPNWASPGSTSVTSDTTGFLENRKKTSESGEFNKVKNSPKSGL